MPTETCFNAFIIYLGKLRTFIKDISKERHMLPERT